MARKLSDWLEYYMQFTQNSEPPVLYHLWSGITAIASALRRKCYCNWGLQGHTYPNMYIALVGPPGGRKGTAMKIAKTMVQDLEIPLGSDALGSTQALYQELINAEADYMEYNNVMQKHKSLSVWSEEFQVFLSEKDPKFIANLTDLFDCPDSWKYTTLKRKTENISNCWLNIFGAITPGLLQTKLSQDAVGGGLMSRIIFVVGYGAIKNIPLPFLSAEEKEIQQALIEDLQQIALLSGPFMLTKDFLAVYSDWYKREDQANHIDNEKFLGYNARRPLHLKKLCMMVSASESNEMKITGTHFEKALAILKETEAEMVNAFHGLGLAAHSGVYAKMLDYLKTTNAFSFNDILSRFQMDTDIDAMKNMLKLAEQTGRVKKEKSATKTMYEVIAKEEEEIKNDYLKNSIYRRML